MSKQNSGQEPAVELTPQIMRAVQIIVRELGTNWQFGFWTQEELLQQAYVWAIEKLPQWDPDKGGNAYTFLRVVIRRQLINLRRDKFERQEKPCVSCPLKAYLPPDGCSAFSERKECEQFANWQARNERKKSLMNSYLSTDVAKESEVDLTSVRDELSYYRERVRDKAGFDALASGSPLSKVRRTSIMDELVEIHRERLDGRKTS